MKKLKFAFVIFGVMAMLFTSCADSKTFEVDNGANKSTVYAEPYGWMNQHKKIEGVEYQICVGNIVWDILLCETIVVPVVLTGVALYEPVKYNPPVNTN